MNARMLCIMFAIAALAFACSTLAGYVLLPDDLPIFQEGWVLIEDRTPETDEGLLDWFEPNGSVFSYSHFEMYEDPATRLF